MGVWASLTEPSSELTSPHRRRQARLMASVLVVAVPFFAVFLPIAIATRPSSVDTVDLVVAVLLTVSGVVSWALTRSRRSEWGTTLVTATAIVGSTFVGAREPDSVRAVFSVLLGLTGPYYASFLLSVQATRVSAAVGLVGMVTAFALNPNVSWPMAVLPLFCATVLLGLTVVSATLRARQVDELERSAALLRTTLDASQDAAMLLSPDGRVSEWSDAAQRLLGISRAEALGRPFTSVVKLDGAPAASLTPHPVEFLAARPDGSSFPCEGLLAALPGGRVAVFLRDISDRKQMEARLMMTDRLETMGRMVAGVAHEINNPLAYITSNLNFVRDALREEPQPLEELGRAVKESIDGARRINGIVQDLRVFSRSGEFEQVGPVDVHAVLESVFGIAQGRLKESQASLVRRFSEVGAVWGIESRLAQVFLNLVVNAAQAVDGCAQRELVVSTRREGPLVIVSVCDSGPGIPEAARKRLFTPFFTTKPAGQGTGLGLYISQSIVSGLRGELRLAPVTQGTCFEVVLRSVTESETSGAEQSG